MKEEVKELSEGVKTACQTTATVRPNEISDLTQRDDASYSPSAPPLSQFSNEHSFLHLEDLMHDEDVHSGNTNYMLSGDAANLAPTPHRNQNRKPRTKTKVEKEKKKERKRKQEKRKTEKREKQNEKKPWRHTVLRLQAKSLCRVRTHKCSKMQKF